MFIKNKTTNIKITNITETYIVIYKYTGDKAPCNVTHACNIGHTTTTVKERIKQHSSIKLHFTETHKENILRVPLSYHQIRASDKNANLHLMLK